MIHPDSYHHVRGESIFTADLAEPAGTLHAAVFASPLAHGRIRNLDLDPARNAPGVVGVFAAADVPGENQIGGIIPDEPLLAGPIVHYLGQPLALVVAETERDARRALALIAAEFDPLPAIFDPRAAFAAGQLIQPPRTFAIGDVDSVWGECTLIVSGRADSGGQEHVYLETQAALAVPAERGGMKVFSATQSPTAVQRTVAQVLGLAMHRVEVDVLRLGGGFGGKEDQATPWAALAALAAWHLNRPVRLVLSRAEDMRLTGKRHPYSSDYRLGLDGTGRMLAYEVTYYQNAGAAADLSPAILERTLFHATNSYFIPHVRATGISCRTHLPPFTAFRGFGGPQAMFVLEAAIDQAAQRLGLPAAEIQKRNLLNDGDVFPYGQMVRRARARRCWQEAEARYDFAAARDRVQRFNETHALEKKGVAVMPVCFGISFTNTALNQAAALVHVYTDGSVSVSTAAVEMGQGVNAKIRRVAARTFGLPPERIQVESTDTMRVANTSPTAASTGADLNGRACELACLDIRRRLLELAAVKLQTPVADLTLRDGKVVRAEQATDLTWEKLVSQAWQARINLSAQAHYATPDVGFDKAREKGNPFAYHAFGTALVEATLDCLRGTYRVDAVRVVHDVGRSLEPLIDLGQVEGGIVQGLGWMTMEELLYSGEGALLTRSLSTYKVPDLRSAPAELAVHFLEQADNECAVMGSKAVGEPPLMYGIGVFFALLAAMRAFQPEISPRYDAPLTPEKVLLQLQGNRAGAKPVS